MRDSLFLQNKEYLRTRNENIFTLENAILSNQNAAIRNYEAKIVTLQATKETETFSLLFFTL